MVAGLPDLILNGSRMEVDCLHVKHELISQVNRFDRRYLEWLYRPFDNKNLLNLLLLADSGFDQLGNYSKTYLLQQIIRPTDLADYLKRFLSQFYTEELEQSPLQAENKLQELFYQEATSSKQAFIRQWFQFEMDVKNLVTAVNCYQYEYDIQTHLIADTTGNGIYQELIKGIPKPDALVWEDRPQLLQVLQVFDSVGDATEKEKEIDQIKFQFLDELIVFNYFTIEQLLSFVLKLQIIERWQKLDAQIGLEFLENLIRDLQEKQVFAEEFSLNQKI